MMMMRRRRMVAKMVGEVEAIEEGESGDGNEKVDLLKAGLLPTLGKNI